MPHFVFDNSYARELPSHAVACKPAAVPAPRLLFLNRELAEVLGLDADALSGDDSAAVFAGNAVPEGAAPIAQAYAGHQFGSFSPELGDGRALLLGEVIDRHGQRRDIALKGSGRTPFSRDGDGKAAVGPMLRELLIGEAMHALGIPTTRALAVVATGEPVFRETPLPGAVLTRVAASHLRVGTFQYFAARGELDALRLLADYAIARHAPELTGQPGRWLGLLRAVAERQARLIAQWMNVGFIHGVMNTDNMTLSGETIDYGPCAFLEAYDPAAVFSSIDRGGRYAYGNQPKAARWNLARLAEALLPLMADADNPAEMQAAVAEVSAVIDAFPELCDAALRRGQRAKLGLFDDAPADLTASDGQLIDAWLALLQRGRVDFTLAWRRLGDAALPVDGSDTALRALFADDPAIVAWLARWRVRIALDGLAAAVRRQRMHAINPWVIARNHRVEEALFAATQGRLQPMNQLLGALRRPFDQDPQQNAYAEPAPAVQTAGYQTFCGT
ncbi:MAG: YdiU family protein [Betaproteobacteria bacterium]|nr:YdiU family protein [Betaproteobacteria bacterium]